MARRAVPRPMPPRGEGPTRRYDILKEATVATVVAIVLVVALAGAALVARCPAGHRRILGPDRPGRLRRHRGQRIGRDERDGHVRPSLQPHHGQLPEHSLHPGRYRRGASAHRRSRDLRACPAGQARPHRSDARRRARPLPARLALRPQCLERRLLEGGRPHQLPSAARRSCPRPPTDPCPSCSPPN